MSLTLDPPTATTTTTATAAARPIWPAQVNLLPPEIRARRALQRASRWLLVGLSVLAAALVGGYVAASLQVSSAGEELASAQAETMRLSQEQSVYADVPAVLGQLSTLQEARVQGLATEIDWSRHLQQVLAVMPETVSVSSVDVVGASPMLAVAPPADPLHGPSVSRIAFTGRSASVPDTAAWVDALNSVPGFSDAWVSGVTRAQDDAHGVHYQVTSSVQVTEAAFTHRFDTTGEN